MSNITLESTMIKMKTFTWNSSVALLVLLVFVIFLVQKINVNYNILVIINSLQNIIFVLKLQIGALICRSVGMSVCRSIGLSVCRSVLQKLQNLTKH